MATLEPSFLTGPSLFLQVSRRCLNEFKFRQYPTTDYRLSALGRLKNLHINVWPLFRLLFLIASSSFMQVIRTCMKAWMSLNFSHIRQLTTELAALQRLKIKISLLSQLLSKYFDDFSCWLSGERSLPFGILLVFVLRA